MKENSVVRHGPQELCVQHYDRTSGELCKEIFFSSIADVDGLKILLEITGLIRSIYSMVFQFQRCPKELIES